MRKTHTFLRNRKLPDDVEKLSVDKAQVLSHIGGVILGGTSPYVNFVAFFINCTISINSDISNDEIIGIVYTIRVHEPRTWLCHSPVHQV